MTRPDRPRPAPRAPRPGASRSEPRGRLNVTDPRLLNRMDATREAEAPPLLLLPMRLEYRVLDAQRPVQAAIPPDHSDLDLLGGAAGVPEATGPEAERDRRRAQLAAALAAPLSSTAVQLSAPREVWFRWYPDEGFAESGVPAVRATETEALIRFDAAVGPRAWYDVADPDVATAWQALAGAVGPARAIHLLRNRGEAGTSRRTGRIAALPRRVALFTVTDGAVTALGHGSQIPAAVTGPGSVSYTPAALEPGGWLNTFPAAVAAGMGLKLTDPPRVDQALAADWVLALGLHDGDGAAELTALLQDAVANGDFSFLPQDTPTNNSPSTGLVGSDLHGDPRKYLETAAQEERGQLPTGGSAAADILATALGVDRVTLRRAPHAADAPFADAQAMLRVIAPALLDATVDRTPALAAVDPNIFISVLAASVAARGPLPVVRFGRNPYGVLPVTQLDELTDTNPSTLRAAVRDLLRRYAILFRGFQADTADQAVPVLGPDDPAAPEKLTEILTLHPVSRRIDVGDAGSAEVNALGCPYTTSAQHPAARYLAHLRGTPIDQLPDPTSAEPEWPLLYRLARLSLVAAVLPHVGAAAAQPRMTLRRFEALTAQQRAALPGASLLRGSIADLSAATGGGTGTVPTQLRGTARDLTEALQHLQSIAARPDGAAELDTLLMEVLDLFQHRADAWAAGLAYARLTARRAREPEGLHAGYYGLLARLRGEPAGRTDGYLQAPSMSQAAAAAVLFATHLRHPDGAFAVDLPSRRVRRALSLLDLQKKGFSLSEALGLRAERWLHDQRQDLLIPALRHRFPLRNPVPPESQDDPDAAAEPVRVQMADGLALLDGDLSDVPEPDRPVLDQLREVLGDDLDALTDLVMCEAVHQRALGQAEAANAWLQVLAGEPVPGDPAFVRTQRHGQGASHRLALVLETAPPLTAGSPREVAEPALAALADRVLADLAGASVPVTVSRTGTEDGAGTGTQADANTAADTVTLNISPVYDLGLRPVDLVIGGESELRVRLRHHVLLRWMTEPALADALGPLPATGLEGFVNREVTVDAALAGEPVDVAALLTTARSLQNLTQRGRALDPADLNAAASPHHPLHDAAETALLTPAITALQQRAQTLMRRIEQDRAELAAAAATFLTRVREARRLADAQPGDDTAGEALLAAEQARRTLIAPLIAASRWAEPAALRLFTTAEAAEHPDELDEHWIALLGRLADRRTALDAAVSHAAQGPAGAPEARAALRRLAEALQQALDGPALPVLPPLERREETAPLLQAPQDPREVLGAWGQVRQGVAAALTAAADIPEVAAFLVDERATDDEAPDDLDPRDEAEAPRARHLGVFLANRSSFPQATAYAGVVVDEWVEQRPSRSQLAALAVRYDTPQSEPPHCLLLCVPPHPRLTLWTEERAADLVWETLQWMKTRALPTDHNLTPAALFPTANQVPFQPTQPQPRPRIPVRGYRLGQLADRSVPDGAFVPADPATGLAGAEAVGIHEIRGRFPVQE